MPSFLLKGRAARGRCQSVIKCDHFHKSVFACETTLKCAGTLKCFDPERTFNQQHFLNVWALAAV